MKIHEVPRALQMLGDARDHWYVLAGLALVFTWLDGVSPPRCAHLRNMGVGFAKNAGFRWISGALIVLAVVPVAVGLLPDDDPRTTFTELRGTDTVTERIMKANHLNQLRMAASASGSWPTGTCSAMAATVCWWTMQPGLVSRRCRDAATSRRVSSAKFSAGRERQQNSMVRRSHSHDTSPGPFSP